MDAAMWQERCNDATMQRKSKAIESASVSEGITVIKLCFPDKCVGESDEKMTVLIKVLGSRRNYSETLSFPCGGPDTGKRKLTLAPF
jgi:hypothetical protein